MCNIFLHGRVKKRTTFMIFGIMNIIIGKIVIYWMNPLNSSI